MCNFHVFLNIGHSEECLIFLISCSKNDPKNIKISTKKKKNLTLFIEKIWENVLTYFQIFSAKIFGFWSKWLILQDFGKIKKKKICQNGKFGSVAPIKQFLFVCLFVFWWPYHRGRGDRTHSKSTVYHCSQDGNLSTCFSRWSTFFEGWDIFWWIEDERKNTCLKRN